MHLVLKVLGSYVRNPTPGCRRRLRRSLVNCEISRSSVKAICNDLQARVKVARLRHCIVRNTRTSSSKREHGSFSEDTNKEEDDSLLEDEWDKDFHQEDYDLQELYDSDGYNNPARGIDQWITKDDQPEAVKRPSWAYWPKINNHFDPSLNTGLVSTNGSTVSELFTHENWLKHRNPFRYFRYLYFLCTGNSVVLVRSAMNVLILGGWALLICIHNTARPQAVLQCDPIPLTLLGAFVSLLLVFRTNSSYARFAEARLLLGQLVLHTREFSRLAVLHFPLQSQRKRALAYIIAFTWCLK
ncbi:hypothetical protein CYMTET_43572, partial [Cymbomonas tetramitiformis]